MMNRHPDFSTPFIAIILLKEIRRGQSKIDLR